MNCAEFKEQVAALALDALEPEEREACRAHLGEPRAHEGCQAALDLAVATAAQLALALPPVLPGPQVWRAIEARLGTAARPQRAERPRRRLIEWAGWAAAAAAVLLLLLVQKWGAQDRRELAGRIEAGQRRLADQAEQLRRAEDDRQQCLREASDLRDQAQGRAELVALLELPATRVTPLALQPGHAGRATAVWNLGQRRALVVARQLPRSEGDYELWVIRGQQKLPAGLLRQGPEGGVAILDPALVAGGVDALAITLEKSGGAPQPSGPILLVGALPRT